MTPRPPSQQTKVQNKDTPDPVDRRLAAAFQPAPQGGHIEDGWENFPDGTMTAEERDFVSDHLTSCRECALVYKGLRAFDAGPAEFDVGASNLKPRMVALESASTRRHWLYATGAGLALAASVAIGVGLLRARPNPAQIRSGDTAGNNLRLVPEDGAPDTQGRISWSAVPGAVAYSVTVFAEDGRVVSRSPAMRAVSAAWPPEARGAGIYFWRVSVANPDDPDETDPIIVSPLARVEIRP